MACRRCTCYCTRTLCTAACVSKPIMYKHRSCCAKQVLPIHHYCTRSLASATRGDGWRAPTPTRPQAHCSRQFWFVGIAVLGYYRAGRRLSLRFSKYYDLDPFSSICSYDCTLRKLWPASHAFPPAPLLPLLLVSLFSFSRLSHMGQACAHVPLGTIMLIPAAIWPHKPGWTLSCYNLSLTAALSVVAVSGHSYAQCSPGEDAPHRHREVLLRCRPGNRIRLAPPGETAKHRSLHWPIRSEPGCCGSGSFLLFLLASSASLAVSCLPFPLQEKAVRTSPHVPLSPRPCAAERYRELAGVDLGMWDVFLLVATETGAALLTRQMRLAFPSPRRSPDRPPPTFMRRCGSRKCAMMVCLC